MALEAKKPTDVRSTETLPTWVGVAVWGLTTLIGVFAVLMITGGIVEWRTGNVQVGAGFLMGGAVCLYLFGSIATSLREASA